MKAELHFTPFLSLFHRELRRFMKVIVQTVLTPLVTSSLYLLIFGLSLGIQSPNDQSYLAFLIPGLVMMGCLNNAFQNASSSVVSSKFSGEFEDYKVSPLSYQQFIWALSFGGVARGILVGVITFLVGQVFHYHVHNEWLHLTHPFILLFFLIVGGLSFAKIGLSVAIWSKTIDQMSAIGTFIITPLIYLGGVFFSLETLPDFWKEVSKMNPLLYLVNGVRYGILGQSDVHIGTAMIVSLTTLFIFHLIALQTTKNSRSFRW